jgi:hypothetical protein
MTDLSISLANVEAAASRIDGAVARTPHQPASPAGRWD